MTKVSSTGDGSPIGPRQVRLLKISIVIMTMLLIAGIIALVYGMARQASRIAAAPKAPPETAVTAAPYSKTIRIGPGEVKDLAVSAERIVMHWKGDMEDTLVIFDARNGNELGRIQVTR
jgi:hypothetical protein